MTVKCKCLQGITGSLQGFPVVGKSYNYHGVITWFIHNKHSVSFWFLQPFYIDSVGFPCRDPVIPSHLSFHGVNICSVQAFSLFFIFKAFLYWRYERPSHVECNLRMKYERMECSRKMLSRRGGRHCVLKWGGNEIFLFKNVSHIPYLHGCLNYSFRLVPSR